tara:strand:- start:304 stop:570 length:267 start_codon:yes stop_codon:yes gene_type:complete
MDNSKILAYQERKANKSTIWILFLFLGWSYGSLNKTGTQILFYITLGGLGFWTIIRLFTLNSAIKEYNRSVAINVGLSSEEMNILNLN